MKKRYTNQPKFFKIDFSGNEFFDTNKKCVAYRMFVVLKRAVVQRM